MFKRLFYLLFGESDKVSISGNLSSDTSKKAPSSESSDQDKGTKNLVVSLRGERNLHIVDVLKDTFK
jgi:hypothetical protein